MLRNRNYRISIQFGGELNLANWRFITNPPNLNFVNIYIYIYRIQNSQAVKKVCGPQKGYGEKRCEIQGGGQEMAVMVG